MTASKPKIYRDSWYAKRREQHRVRIEEWLREVDACDDCGAPAPRWIEIRRGPYEGQRLRTLANQPCRVDALEEALSGAVALCATCWHALHPRNR